MKNISILGSTGSIGTQTLDVIGKFPEDFRVYGLAAGRNIALVSKQIEKYKPDIVSVIDKKHAEELEAITGGSGVKIVYGDPGHEELVAADDVDIVVSATVGASGLKPTFSAIRAGKNIALANKESLVIGGELLMRYVKNTESVVIPVDSEHSAIFQALQAESGKFLKRIIITASGGPFRKLSAAELKNVTVEDALDHPTWKMGKKISVDSATLMNKGFELIEARWLFDISAEKISVWIHPQSIVHSMVEYIDGSILSQLSLPDMKIPIAYALSYPDRIKISDYDVSPRDFSNLTFEDVDTEKFTSLSIARQVLIEGGTMPAVFNASNEVAVDAFLNRKIGFTQIMSTIEKTLQKHNPIEIDSLETIFEADHWARSYANSIINKTGEQ